MRRPRGGLTTLPAISRRTSSPRAATNPRCQPNATWDRHSRLDDTPQGLPGRDDAPTQVPGSGHPASTRGAVRGSAGRPGRRIRADRPLRGSRVATGSAGPSRRAGRVSPAARAGSGAWFRTASRPDFVITTEKLKEIRESFPNYRVAEKQLLLLRHTHHAVVAEAEAGREGLLVVVVGPGRQRSTRLAGHVPSAATSWRVPSS